MMTQPGPNLQAVLDEQDGRWSTAAPLQLVVAVVADAMGEGAPRETVAMVRERLEWLYATQFSVGVALTGADEAAVLQALRYKPALFEALDDLEGPTPDRAWSTLQAMGLAERAGAL